MTQKYRGKVAYMISIALAKEVHTPGKASQKNCRKTNIRVIRMAVQITK